MADAVVVPVSAAFVSPRAAHELTSRCQLRLVLTIEARRSGRRLSPLAIEVIEVLEAAAAMYQPARPLVECPHGHGGRPELEQSVTLVSTAEAARMIQRTDRTVRRLLEQRDLTGERIGGKQFVDVASVHEYRAYRHAREGEPR